MYRGRIKKHENNLRKRQRKRRRRRRRQVKCPMKVRGEEKLRRRIALNGESDWVYGDMDRRKYERMTWLTACD